MINIDRSGRMTVRNKTFAELLVFAYQLHPRQVRNLPEGLGSERFDILAKPDIAGQPNDRQLRSMLKKLMADRFMLALHYEKREMAVYAVSVARSGPKLAKTQSTGILPGETGTSKTVFTNARIADLSDFLQAVVVDRPVVDQTGLEGRYDFTLNWTPDETQFPDNGLRRAAVSDASAETYPDLYTAMQQQLGLKLESTKAQVDILVIDHVEKPSEN